MAVTTRCSPSWRWGSAPVITSPTRSDPGEPGRTVRTTLAAVSGHHSLRRSRVWRRTARLDTPAPTSAGPAMSDTPQLAETEPPRLDPDALRDAEDHLNPLWVERLRARLDADDTAAIVALTEPLHAADMGDLLEALAAEERVRLVTILGDKFDFSA